MTKSQAIDLARRVGGTAHPENPYDPDTEWYVLGELAANTRTRARWELRDGKPVITEAAYRAARG